MKNLLTLVVKTTQSANMKTRIYSFLIAVTIFTLSYTSVYANGTDIINQAKGVVERSFGAFPERVTFAVIDKAEGCDRYRICSEPDALRIEGSSAVAICKGFHDYILENGFGLVSWTGNRLELPKRLPRLTKEVTSPFRHHLYQNVCAYGYTYALWGWEQWEREIDWMAMHGFDMPLAPTAGEAIFARTWKKFGLSDEEIAAYFSGPLHMPWMRMGNMSALDGGMSQKWHDEQIALQHKINDRMLALGMTPVYQGFAGFVPKAFKTHYPEINLTTTKWAGLESYMLSPLDELFSQIGTEFIREWEREFGKGTYYLIDSFNEMEIPFGKKGSQERFDTLQKYSSVLYNSLSAANPDAVWVMQGWMFGYSRHIWDPQSVDALLSGAPKGKMLVIDLAVDFNEYVWQSENSWDYLNGFFGQEWIWSTVPNFGGRTALKGPLDFYLNGHLEAVNSPNKGSLTGFGTSPEGVESNEIIYEIISHAGWSASEISVAELLTNYTKARYGSAHKALVKFWSELRQSVYNNFTNNARFHWQWRQAYHRTPTMNINEHYYDGIESFLSVAERFKDNGLYRTDAVQYAALYLAAKADDVLKAANWALVAGDIEKAEALQALLDRMLLDMDRLLESHPILRMQRWIDFAQTAGTDDTERKAFAEEAKRIVSTWGGPKLFDYSTRVWSGLIRDYYAPRLRHYYASANKSKYVDMAEFDDRFRTAELSTAEPYADPLKACVELVKRYSDINCNDRLGSVAGADGHDIPEWNRYAPDNAITYWCPQDFAGKTRKTISTTIPATDYIKMNGLLVKNSRGGDVRITRIRFRANHVNLLDAKADTESDPSLQTDLGGTLAAGAQADIPCKGPDSMDGLSREVTLYVTIEGSPESWGTISWY